MFNTAPKRIGWFCLLCVVIIGSWFSVKVLVPSLTAFRATTPYLTIHLKPNNRYAAIAFTPDGKQFLYAYHIDRNMGIKRWDVNSGKELPSIQCKNKNQDISTLSDDGRYYVVYVKSHEIANDI